MANQHEANLINEDRAMMAAMMQENLEKMGVTCSVAHYTGDSSFPVEYTLTYSDGQGRVSAVGPTLDLAAMDFIGQLLRERTRRND